MKEALKPFADLLEDPQNAVTDENGLVQVFVDPDDVQHAKNVLANPRFLLIAYKTDSVDYCRGCLMASYSSDHEIHTQLTAEQLTDIWASYLLKNMDLGCNEAGYTFWVFKDGVKVWNENYSTWDGGDRYGYESDEYYSHYNVLQESEQADQGEINEIYAKAKALAEANNNAKKKAAADKAAKEKAAAEEKAKADRLAQYQKLQQEFGPRA